MPPYAGFILHAQRVHFEHPVTGAPMTIEAPLPRRFAEAVSRLR